MRAVTLLALALCGGACGAKLVQFRAKSGGTCLSAVTAAEAGAIALGDCADVALSAWDDALDALDNPQLSLGSSAGALCVNDDSVRCGAGNVVKMHACQLSDPHVHKANHFAYDAASGRIATVGFCPGMCLGVAAVPDAGGVGGAGSSDTGTGSGSIVQLAPCSGSVAWTRADAPPTKIWQEQGLAGKAAAVRKQDKLNAFYAELATHRLGGSR